MAPPPPGSPEGVAGAAVRSAYAVVEENIEEGRRTAERLRAAAPAPTPPTPNTRDVANRLLYVTREFGATWVDLISAVLREPEVRSVLDRLTSQPRAKPRDDGPVQPFIQRISSKKPLEMDVPALPSVSWTSPPAVTALHPLSAGPPAITGVLFGLRPDGRLELRIDVADDQPAGIYVGAVVDVVSERPLGALSVKVLG